MNLLQTLSPEQEEVLTKYCDEIFASGAETEEFFYRLDIKDGLRLKSTVKSVLEMISWNRNLSENLSIDHLAEKFFFSKYHMMRKFKKETGYTIHNYIISKRLLHARSLITQGTPIMKAAKELQTFKNIAEKKLPDKDIEEFH